MADETSSSDDDDIGGSLFIVAANLSLDNVVVVFVELWSLIDDDDDDIDGSLFFVAGNLSLDVVVVVESSNVVLATLLFEFNDFCFFFSIK